MTTLDIPIQRITSPAALVAMLPTLIGFTPEDSLVIVFLEDDRVIVTMRMDLGETSYSVNEHVVTTARRVGANAALIATYTGDRTEAQACTSLVTGITAALEDAGVPVRDALAIAGDRYWSHLCQDNRCCGREGNVVPDLASETRDDVVARFTAQPERSPGVEALELATGEADPDLLIRGTQAWESVQLLSTIDTSCPDSPDAELLRARVLVWCQHVHVRDFVLCSLAAVDTDPDALVDVVVQTALRAPGDLRPRMAGMAAALLAACGVSSIPASCLADLAEEDSLAQLVSASISSAVPPQVLREMFANGLDEVLRAIQSTQPA